MHDSARRRLADEAAPLEFAARIGLGIARAINNRLLRAEAARLRAQPREPELLPASAPLPEGIADCGGHDASGEGC